MGPLGLSIYKPDQAYLGYTLFAPMQTQDAYLIDMRGNVVQRWELPYRPGDYGYLLENGNLMLVVVEDPCADRESIWTVEWAAVP